MAKKMDQLTLDCIAAQKAGMTYGKWKALQPRVEVVIPQEPELPEDESEVNKEPPKRLCRACGKVITTLYRKNYCSDKCQYEGHKANARACYRRKTERMIANGEI